MFTRALLRMLLLTPVAAASSVALVLIETGAGAVAVVPLLLLAAIVPTAVRLERQVLGRLGGGMPALPAAVALPARPSYQPPDE